MPSLYFCAAATHLIDVFVTLDIVNGDKIIGEIMLVVCSNLVLTNLFYIPKMSAHTGLSDNCDVGATTLLQLVELIGEIRRGDQVFWL